MYSRIDYRGFSCSSVRSSRDNNTQTISITRINTGVFRRTNIVTDISPPRSNGNIKAIKTTKVKTANIIIAIFRISPPEEIDTNVFRVERPSSRIGRVLVRATKTTTEENILEIGFGRSGWRVRYQCVGGRGAKMIDWVIIA